MSLNFISNYLNQTATIAKLLSIEDIDFCIEKLCEIRSRHGRLFVLGVGGSAANASHAVNDFRKLAGIEAYAPTDNISETTARTNDEGWETIFEEWLKVSRLGPNDLILILSVGGGNLERGISVNICNAILYAKKVSAPVIGIVGKMSGYTYQYADKVILIPVEDELLVTPHTESFQEIIWHLMVSHPKLKINATTW
jgi:D-sedoheptulose 7-phosphate isomerase